MNERKTLKLRCIATPEEGGKYRFRDQSGTEWLSLSPATNPAGYTFTLGLWYTLDYIDGIPEAMTTHDHWCDWGHWVKEITK